MRRSGFSGWTARGLFGLLLATSLIVSGCGTSAQNDAAPGAGKQAQANASQAITPPIAAAWLYMSDDHTNQAYNRIPDTWSQINFKNVDVLNVGPAGVQADGTFGLYNSPQTGDLSYRFKWVLNQARTQNPGIKIILSQWWGEGDGIWGSSLGSLKDSAAVEKYTTSVGAFLKSYLGISGGVDGYDIDYESNNVTDNTAAITKQIRAQMTSLSNANAGRPFYQTVSPSETSNLKEAIGYLDFVNMQTYAGGSPWILQELTDLGFKNGQLLYGICPETSCPGPSLADVEAAYTNNKLAGIHLWRLNSDNQVHEGQVQSQVYQFLHPKK